MIDPVETPKVPVVDEVRILVEHRSRRQGGKRFHIRVRGIDIVLTQKDAVKQARSILKISKEK